jgi:endonuclease/exonuclease/phosphatase family metal-dependent hydrolase
MDLTVLSWNVEHFTGDKTGSRADRVHRVVDLIAQTGPDVFAVIEVEGKVVFSEFVARMPGYSFAITEGPETQEILVGMRHGITAFMTQKNAFKRSNPSLRPGALVTVTTPGGQHLPILFNHLKSMSSPEGFGLRDAMGEKAFGLKRSIDGAAEALGQPGRFILMGDLNTMGMNLKDSDRDIAAAEEIARLGRRFARYGMVHLDKTHAATFNNGSGSSYPPADLDHVFATDNLAFADMGGGKRVKVSGWALEGTVQAQDAWIDAFSDHAPISFRVTGL